MKIKRVGVVGCGFMGSGIVQTCAQSGYQVVMLDLNTKLPHCSVKNPTVHIKYGYVK